LSEVTLYTKAGCHLCEDALAVLQRLRAEIPFEIRARDIEQDEALLRAYFERIPVIALDGVELCDHFLDEDAVRQALLAKRA
jgi:glutaredoxin